MSQPVQAFVTTPRICSPGNLRAQRATPTTVVLTWDEPYATCNVCPDAQGFEISGEGIATVIAERSPGEVRTFTPDREHLIQVRAVAAVNNLSNPSSVRLPRLPALNKPGVPVVSDITWSSARVSWTASTGSRFDEYVRYRVFINGFIYALTKEPHCKLVFLRNHAEYRVEVLAVYENTWYGSDAVCATFRTLLRPPILRFSQHNGVGRLSWAPNFWVFPEHRGTVNGSSFTTGPLHSGYCFSVAERAPGPAPHHLSFEVRAHAGEDVSAVSKLEVTVDDIIPPGRPGTPVASALRETSALLSWAPSTDNRAVAEYRLARWGGNTMMLDVVKSGTQITYTDLNSGTRYLLVVRARDLAGNQSIPNEVMFKTPGTSAYPVPLAPLVKISPQSSTSALLEWTFQDDIGRSVRISLNGEYHSDVTHHKSKILENLIPGTEYVITVIAYSALAAQLSEATTLVYEARDVTPPSIPGNLRSIGSAPYSVTLAWEESSDDTAVYGYVIYNNFEYCGDVLTSPYTATALYPGLHLFHVRALDVFGNPSEPAVTLVKVTGEDPPTRPGAPLVSELTDTSVLLTWAPSSDEGAVVVYDIERWGGGRETNRLTEARCVYTGLRTGTRYLFVVRAVDPDGNKSLPREVMFKTTGPSPDPDLLAPKVTITPKTSTSALLQWTFHDEAGRASGVRISVNGLYHSDVFAPLKSRLLTDLVPGLEYTITVIAYTPLVGLLSEPATLRYTCQPDQVPSAPGALRITGASTDSVTLGWEELTLDGVPCGYLIYDNQTFVGSTLDSHYYVTGLTPGPHSISLRSLDLAGNVAELGSAVVQIQS